MISANFGGQPSIRTDIYRFGQEEPTTIRDGLFIFGRDEVSKPVLDADTQRELNNSKDLGRIARSGGFDCHPPEQMPVWTTPWELGPPAKELPQGPWDCHPPTERMPELPKFPTTPGPIAKGPWDCHPPTEKLPPFPKTPGPITKGPWNCHPPAEKMPELPKGPVPMPKGPLDCHPPTRGISLGGGLS